MHASPLPPALRSVLILLLLGLAGCYSVERTERPLTLRVESEPPGAEIAVSTAGGGDALRLGRAPIQLPGLLLVQKEFVNGAVDYWLADPEGHLPKNPAKPPYASRPYLVGSHYPLDLRFAAALQGRTAQTRVEIDRGLLERLFQKNLSTLTVRLKLPGGS